ncbi:nuclear transport factor 2-like [Chenopodium quinoa]|uniref:nuclear transport factor 2-like n=1 Tax=Chenopodium quinoa TaxID=63459 RepID=UPI000B77B66B|nr:nuclear transport factor 2-like [Chenopodium quinoa]
MEDYEGLGTSFVIHYYNLFDNERPSLISLYQPTSLLTFEGQKFQGVEEISNKINSLPFNQCLHSISTIDTQPSSINGGIIVFVSGSLQLAGEEHQLRFSQMFHLIPTTQGSYFVQNDIFRLNYC